MSALQATIPTTTLRPASDHVASQSAFALIDLIDCGLLMCDRHAALLYANRAAYRELADARSLEIRNGTVHCKHGAPSELQSAVREAADRRRSRLLSLGEGSSRLTVVAMPFAFDHAAEPAALLMIGHRSPCSRLALAMLATRHHLTFTEHRVLQGILAGQTAREIAADLCVRMTTVRTHLQKVREKFGVRSIDELLLLVARVPPVSTM